MIEIAFVGGSCVLGVIVFLRLVLSVSLVNVHPRRDEY